MQALKHSRHSRRVPSEVCGDVPFAGKLRQTHLTVVYNICDAVFCQDSHCLFVIENRLLIADVWAENSQNCELCSPIAKRVSPRLWLFCFSSEPVSYGVRPPGIRTGTIAFPVVHYSSEPSCSR